MYFDEHNPPHFHVRYGDYRASIAINDLKMMEGQLPKRVLALVLEWAYDHREELSQNWESLKATGQFNKIQPLE